MKIWVKVALVSSLVILAALAYALSNIKSIAAGYLYGYPLVLMDQSRQVFLESGADKSRANQFTHIQSFPDHTFRNVVRPNNDTLYSIAWIDLSDEPLILSVPDTKGRYYVMPFMDAWTNVFAMVGRRTTGSGAGDYLIVGPDWSESKSVSPLGVTTIKAPTNMVFLIGRIQTNGESDISNVADIQTEFVLTPLSLWEGAAQGARAKTSAKVVTVIADDSADPMAMVGALSGEEFFLALSRLLSEQASVDQDADALSNLASFGVDANKPFGGFGAIDSMLADLAIDITHSKIDERIDARANLESGWAVHRSVIGNYGSNYALRAGVAKIGLGALPPAEAAYPNASVDSNGRALSGKHRYNIHFAKGQTPPVNAFWSLSLYDDDGFYTDNAIKRYSIGDRDELHYNADGSLDILIQTDQPAIGASNWLPAPSGNFALTMRLYSPKASFLNGDWQLPSIEPR